MNFKFNKRKVLDFLYLVHLVLVIMALKLAIPEHSSKLLQVMIYSALFFYYMYSFAVYSIWIKTKKLTYNK